MITEAINERYTQLSESTCCLSCGGAINYAKPLSGEVCVDLGSGRGNDVIRMAEEVGETGQNWKSYHSLITVLISLYRIAPSIIVWINRPFGMKYTEY